MDDYRAGGTTCSVSVCVLGIQATLVSLERISSIVTGRVNGVIEVLCFRNASVCSIVSFTAASLSDTCSDTVKWDVCVQLFPASG